MKFFNCLLVLILVLFSCKKKDSTLIEENNSKIKSASFEKLDSLTIGFLGIPNVQDIDPISRTVIFINRSASSEDIFIADFDGEIVNSFSKFGDMPDNYGRMRATIKILGGRKFLVYGNNSFFTYNYSGENLSKIRHDIGIIDYSEIAMGSGLEKSGEKFLYLNSSEHKFKNNDLRFYNEATLLAWLNPETGKKESIIQFPESSLFRNGKFFHRDSWIPIYTLSNDFIYVVFGMEPVIYTYENSPPYLLLSSIPIELPEYQLFNGSEDYGPGFEIQGFSSSFGRVKNIKKVDDVFIVGYSQGYDSYDREVSTSSLTLEERNDFRKKMGEKYQDRIVVLDSAGNFISEIEPGNLYPSSLIERNQELWMLERPDTYIERDFFRLFKVGLKLGR